MLNETRIKSPDEVHAEEQQREAAEAQANLTFLDASGNLDMALDRIAALSLAIQERAEVEGSSYIVTLAHLINELAENAQQDRDRQSEAAKEWRIHATRSEDEGEEKEAA